MSRRRSRRRQRRIGESAPVACRCDVSSGFASPPIFRHAKTPSPQLVKKAIAIYRKLVSSRVMLSRTRPSSARWSNNSGRVGRLGGDELPSHVDQREVGEACGKLEGAGCSGADLPGVSSSGSATAASRTASATSSISASAATTRTRVNVPLPDSLGRRSVRPGTAAPSRLGELVRNGEHRGLTRLSSGGEAHDRDQQQRRIEVGT
jgi:hypothetical protein